MPLFCYALFCDECCQPVLSFPVYRADHILQTMVYKLVPGLFNQEMKMRRDFYEWKPYAGKSAGWLRKPLPRWGFLSPNPGGWGREGAWGVSPLSMRSVILLGRFLIRKRPKYELSEYLAEFHTKVTDHIIVQVKDHSDFWLYVIAGFSEQSIRFRWKQSWWNNMVLGE